MLARSLPLLLVLVGCPDPTAAPEGGGMSDKPMGGGAPGEPGQPGQPGMGGPPGGEGGPTGRPTAPGFQVTAGEGVKLTDSLSYTGTKTGVYRIDFLKQSEQASFPELVHSIELPAPGPWEVEAPKDAGEFWVVSFLDANGNGPDPSEPAARVKDLVRIGTEPIGGLDLVLSDDPDLGELKPNAKEGPPGTLPPGGEMKPGETPPGGAPPGGAPPGSVPPGAPPTDAGAPPAGAPPVGK